MSDKVMKDIKVDDVVGKLPGEIRKPVQGVVNPTKEVDAGYMDEGNIHELTTPLYTKDHKRG